MLTLWALLSFDTVAFGKNIFLGHLKAFLILKYIHLRCSTFPSAEAPDFVYNLRRCSLIRINLGFTIFILVRFGLYKKKKKKIYLCVKLWGSIILRIHWQFFHLVFFLIFNYFQMSLFEKKIGTTHLEESSHKKTNRWQSCLLTWDGESGLIGMQKGSGPLPCQRWKFTMMLWNGCKSITRCKKAQYNKTWYPTQTNGGHPHLQPTK